MLGFRFFVFTREGVELDFAGLAVAGFDGVYDSRARVWADGEAIDEDEDGGVEVELEERLGGGELDDLFILIETVVASSAKFGEAVFEGVSDGREADYR